jgi:hypothetical protein
MNMFVAATTVRSFEAMPRHGATVERPSSPEAGHGTRWGQNPRRVAVLFEPGRAGVAALEYAAGLLAEGETELTVLALAPQLPRPRCGGHSPEAYNCAVIEHASSELDEAAHQLSAVAGARFRVLIEHDDSALEVWIAENAVELVVLPARRRALGPPRHPAAQRIRRHAPAEVRVISPGRR